MIKFKEAIYNQHNIVCNQKYANTLPYSFHLMCVEQQGKKFLHLIENETIINENNFRALQSDTHTVVCTALLAHDVIEDGRLTYNDILELANDSLDNYVAGKMVAEIVYCVTDEKGKNRGERKNEKYYEGLSKNKLAVFVKLADLSANTLFSKLTGSSMYAKYKKEFSAFKEKTYVAEYEEFFNYVENL